MVLNQFQNDGDDYRLCLIENIAQLHTVLLTFSF